MGKRTRGAAPASKKDVVLVITPDATIQAAATIMKNRNVGCLVVVDGRRDMLGIISERDILAKVIAQGLDPGSTAVGDVMVREVVSCGLNTPLTAAQAVMADHGIRHLPIVQDGRPVGMISTRDIMAYQLSTVQAVVKRQTTLLNELERTGASAPPLPKIPDDGRVVIDAVDAHDVKAWLDSLSQDERQRLWPDRSQPGSASPQA